MKRLTLVFTFVFVALLLTACAGGENSNPPEIPLITAEEAKARLDGGEEIIFLDVRTVYEYEKMRIPGSILLPLEDYETLVPELLPDKDAFIAAYCDVGGQSGRLVEYMMEMGYTQVYQLGKFRNWQYEVERGPN